MNAITNQQLINTCDQQVSPYNAKRAVWLLQSLAPWWLSDAAINEINQRGSSSSQRLLQRSCELSETPGSCWIVCQLTKPMPLLRNGLLFPLRWSTDPSPNEMPHSLLDLARTVADEVALSSAHYSEATQWHLHPDPRIDLGETSLADDVFSTFDSGWVSLAGGLISAISGFKPLPTVWASCDWRGERGPYEVDGLEAKMAEAVRNNARCFAVADIQEAEAKKFRRQHGWNLSIVSLTKTKVLRPQKRDINLIATLQPYLNKLYQQPDPPSVPEQDDYGFADHSQFDVCCDYFLIKPSFSRPARDFYSSHLLRAIAKRCRDQLLARYDFDSASHYIAIVSKSPEVSVIGAEAVSAEKCLLLYTSETADQRRYCSEHLGDDRITFQPIDRDNPLPDIKRHVKCFTTDVSDASRVVLDIKPGTKKMTHAMLSTLRPGWRVFCLAEDFGDDRRTTPGSEKPEFIIGDVR